MIDYYDRHGMPISSERYIELLKDKHERGKETGLVIQTYVNGWLVSTVWLGLDHNWGGGRPLIWETMVFASPGNEEPATFADEYMCRYSSEEEAQAGHAVAVVHAESLPSCAVPDSLEQWTEGDLNP